MTHYTLVNAWENYESGKLELSAKIWLGLIEKAKTDQSEETRRNHELGYSYVLIAQKDFSAARNILERLFQETQESIYLHQLGMLEREAENYPAALTCFEKERTLLDTENYFGRAINGYELGLIAFKQNDSQSARQYAEASLKDGNKIADPMVEGCARRLLGDIASASGDQERAREHYVDARLAFNQAQDLLAVQEIEIRLNALD